MKKISIMVVDDNYAERYILSRFIQDLDYSFHVTEKENGLEAINYFTEFDANNEIDPEIFPPDIIFLDINMPILDGFEFLDKLNSFKQEKQFEKTYVMMLSTSALDEEIEKALSYDFVSDYLVKGKFTSATLKEKINSIIVQ